MLIAVEFNMTSSCNEQSTNILMIAACDFSTGQSEAIEPLIEQTSLFSCSQ